MTIDKVVAEIKQQKLDYQVFWGEYMNEHIEALDTAICIMRKYQKIEQTLDDCDLEAWEVLEKVKEVVEDGEA